MQNFADGFFEFAEMPFLFSGRLCFRYAAMGFPVAEAFKIFPGPDDIFPDDINAGRFRHGFGKGQQLFFQSLIERAEIEPQHEFVLGAQGKEFPEHGL